MNIDEKVKEILTDLCGEENINNEDSLQNDLFLDSLSMVMLLVEIEESFDIQLDESDMNPFDLLSVQDVINLVEKYTIGDNYE